MIRTLIELYTWVIIADIILSYLPQFRSHPIAEVIHEGAEFTCKPVRKALAGVMPESLPIDISHLVVIVGLHMIQVLW